MQDKFPTCLPILRKRHFFSQVRIIYLYTSMLKNISMIPRIQVDFSVVVLNNFTTLREEKTKPNQTTLDNYSNVSLRTS